MRVVHAQKRLESSIGQAPAGTKAPSQEELAVVKDLRGDPLRYRAELCISWVSTFGDQIRLCGGAIPCSPARSASLASAHWMRGALAPPPWGITTDVFGRSQMPPGRKMSPGESHGSWNKSGSSGQSPTYYDSRIGGLLS